MPHASLFKESEFHGDFPLSGLIIRINFIKNMKKIVIKLQSFLATRE